MVHLDLTQILSWIQHYGALVVFPAAVVEGPIVTVISGFLVSLGYLGFFFTYVLIVIADLVGDTVYYAAGRWGQIGRWGKVFGATPQRVEKAKRLFDRRGGKVFLFGKAAHGIGVIPLMAAGLVRFPYKTFLFYNLIGTIPKTLLLLVVGYYFGRFYVELDRYFSYAGYITIAIGVVLIVIYVIYRNRSSRGKES
jgi:membrane protein DedA with SNARE-associated domain